ncbi:ankyrin repeat domain-containing protein, partial [Burkholderia gladioli]
MSNIPLSWLAATQQEKDHALIGAVTTSSVGVMDMLLRAGANPKAQRPSGSADGHMLTALNLAASPGASHHDHRCASMLTMLLDHDPGAFSQDEKDHALRIAVRSNADAVRVLLDRGANPNAKEGAFERTALHEAILVHGDVDMLTVLLDAGADIDERDAQMDAPLRLAIELGRTAAVRLLLDRGADTRVMHSPDHHVAHLATEGTDVWSMLVLDERTGPFRQRFEQTVKGVHSATLKELLAQRTPEDDLSGGIPRVLNDAYMWTSGNRQGEKVKTPNQWWAEARLCVRMLVKAGALDRTIDHHYGQGSNLSIPAWFNTVRPEIRSGNSEFERTATTLTKLFIGEEQKALRSVLPKTVTAERPARARL